MRLLDLTLPTPEENLALDEALLEEAESSPAPIETLRLWEPARALVVIGRGSRLAVEVNERECQAGEGVPILRRTSGGASIVTGPGCLMYALVLSYAKRPDLRSIDVAHTYVMGTISQSLAALVPGVARRGICDLTLGDKKFSGNSLRCKKRTQLYHGTLLYDFPLEQVGRYLNMPPRVPDYRAGRAHDEFVANLPLRREGIVRALVTAFAAKECESEWPRELTSRLVGEKYSQREWNYQR